MGINRQVKLDWWPQRFRFSVSAKSKKKTMFVGKVFNDRNYATRRKTKQTDSN